MRRYAQGLMHAAEIVVRIVTNICGSKSPHFWNTNSVRLLWRIQGESVKLRSWTKDVKRVIGIIAGIIMARNLDRADDLFGGPQGSPRTDKMIAAAVCKRIMARIDNVYSDEKPKSVAQKA